MLAILNTLALADVRHMIVAFVVLVILLIVLWVVSLILGKAPIEGSWKPVLNFILFLVGGLLIIGFLLEIIGYGPSTWR